MPYTWIIGRSRQFVHLWVKRLLLGGQAYHKCALLGLFGSCLTANIAKAEVLDPAEWLVPFTTDGCSLFPDGSLWQQDLWRECCVDHDLAYWRGGDYTARREADEALLSCVDAQGEPAVAVTMLLGVRFGGSPYWMTPFRWGYGWKVWRGYEPLSERDVALLDAMLNRPLTKRDK